MTEIQIAWLELMTMGTVGAVLALSGVIVAMIAKKRTRSCTRKVEGTVKNHGFPGGGRMYPIVEYHVNGIRYRAKKKFNGVRTRRISGFPIPMKEGAHEDEKGWLHVTLGPIVNLRQLAEELWPIGSRMMVYYDPDDPKCSYVDRPIARSIVPAALVLAGAAVASLGVLVFLLMRL